MTNKEKSENLLDNILDSIIEDYKDLVNNAKHFDRLYIINEVLAFGECTACKLDDIKKYVNQLEKEIKKYKQKPQIRQVVVRTYPFGKHPREYRTTNEDLKEYLNKGYHVVMANKVIDGVIEYILQKEVIENGR